MPALEIFRRRWLLAGDDLFIPFLAETIIRIVLAIASSVMLWIHLYSGESSDYVTVFLSLLLADLLLNIILCAALTCVSGTGSVMQVEKRALLPKMLYTKFVSFWFDLSLTAAAIYFGFLEGERYNLQPQIDIYIKILVAVSIVYFAIVVACVALTYTALGGPKYWVTPENQTTPEFVAKYFEKADRTWYRRLKYALCCFGWSRNKKQIYRDLAHFFAKLLGIPDLVPTDVLAGMVILSRKHSSERRRLKFMDSLCSQGYISNNDDSHPAWMTAENASYYMRLSKVSYGWPILVHTCNPFTIASKTKCFGIGNYAIGKDNCCNCNIGVLRSTTGYSDDDFIFMSYAPNGIYKPAFYVVLDKPRSAIVIVIRGTFSPSDLVTTVCADAETVKVGGRDVYCHKGVLRGATYIRNKLMDLGILKAALAEHPDFNIVTVGHSLGASVSSVLGLLLREDFSNLQSYCFSPLPTMSLVPSRMCMDFMLSVVIGDDIVPRLCLKTCENLRLEILKSLEECEIQKYKILVNAGMKCLFNKKLFRSQSFPKNTNSLRQNCAQSEQIFTEDDSWVDNGDSLFTPGRVLYLEKTCDGIKALWKTGCHFHRVIVSLNMFLDHQPRRVQDYLEELCHQSKSQTLEESKAAAINLAYSPSPEPERKSLDTNTTIYPNYAAHQQDNKELCHVQQKE